MYAGCRAYHFTEELTVERHTGRRVQCCRQMDHKKPLLFGQCAKLDP